MSCIITGYLLYIYTYVHVSKLNDACSGSITAACHTSRGRFDRTEPFQVAQVCMSKVKSCHLGSVHTVASENRMLLLGDEATGG